MVKLKPLVLMMACVSGYGISYAAEVPESTEADPSTQANNVMALETIRIVASADASAEGLMAPFAGGQVASGGRVGIFGNQSNLDSPFSLTSYTNQYIQERQANSVGDVLQADPSVRLAKGFGNFQETYFIRGFVLASDDTSYNGLYGILPRQYIPTELFERVEVFKGASAFLNGAMPGGSGIGGSVNLVPKRAANEPLKRVTAGTDFNGGYLSSDVSERFGENDEYGVRVNTAYHGGGTEVEKEDNSLGLASIALDYRGDQLRLSGDLGYNNNRLKENRPSLRLTNAVTSVPSASQYADYHGQSWTYSNEEDVFGSYRAEYDFNDAVTAYAAYGFRVSEEAGVYSSQQLKNTDTGDASLSASTILRKDKNHTGEVGVKTKFNTGALSHNVVLSGSMYRADKRYSYGYATGVADNFYNPIYTNASNINQWLGAEGTYPKASISTLKSVALGDNITALDDRLTVMLGARYQEVDQDAYYYGTYLYNINKDKVTPALGISYKITPELAVYGNYVEALVQGDGLLDSSTGNYYVADPFVSKQKEIGLKYENGAIGGGLNYFNTERRKAAINATGTAQLTNAKNIHQGIEFNAYGQLTDAVRILGGATWIDTEQKETYQGLFDGNQAIGVPEFQANLEADWKLPVPQDVSINGRVVYTGSQYANNANTLKLNDWTRVDVGANYKTQINQVPTVINFGITNLFDKEYWASASVNDSTYLSLGQPRTFTLSASFDF
ncbi:TonB-dependent receptor [Acinetobacter johnsonii]|uniref:TonB-dependent receptor n=1 Tax=Acinetobacter johnsonii TaxID=40214 RepID=UPI001F1C1288|nr:TonB-dependent receptor [Acinetobacter johnsonii]UJA00880.1 TonB-dependent siderophore receptor [Acinetobacter johnsonii]